MDGQTRRLQANHVRNLANSAIQILSCLLYGRRLVERSAINVFCHLKKTWNPSSQVRSLSVNVVAPALHLSPNPRRLVDRFLESAHMRGISSKQHGVYILVQ